MPTPPYLRPGGKARSSVSNKRVARSKLCDPMGNIKWKRIFDGSEA